MTEDEIFIQILLQNPNKTPPPTVFLVNDAGDGLTDDTNQPLTE